MLGQLKRCSRCGRDKPLDQFNVRVSVSKGVVAKAWCNECETPAQVYQRDPIQRKEYQTLKRYGINLTNVEAMGAAQGWLCYLCDADITNAYYIDHNHATGKLRKLLCLNCNVALGQFKDSIPVLQRAIEYLREHE